ncbi:MAG: hypothetical protein FWC70_04975 [Defluviitaleaceae bacterium]|nr:hypothetical protein [Defluviitaleaceae bacterium]
MKNWLVRILSVGAVAGLMAFSTGCTPEETQVLGALGSDVELLGHTDEPYDLVNHFTGCEISDDWTWTMPEFMSFSGTVVEIMSGLGPAPVDDEPVSHMLSVMVQGEEDADGYSPTVNFTIDRLTAIFLDGELEVGASVTGFYEVGAAMILIYPPQHNARLLVSDPDVTVTHFSDELEIGADTEIIFQDGTLFDGELDELKNRTIAVLSSEKIVVLFERAVHPELWLTDDDFAGFDGGEIDFGWGGGLELTQEDLDMMWDSMFDPETVQIVVNDTAIDSPRPFIDREAGVVMLPVVAIAEALGYTVTGEGFGTVVGMYGAGPHAVAFIEGEDAYMIGRLDTVSLGAPPALVDEILFVPMGFFGRALEAAAWISCGDVVISNTGENDMF